MFLKRKTKMESYKKINGHWNYFNFLRKFSLLIFYFQINDVNYTEFYSEFGPTKKCLWVICIVFFSRVQ